MKALITILFGLCSTFLFTACEPTICDNSCPFADDGVCDDGGDGAVYDVCQYGSDCNDCGERMAR